MRRLLFVGLVLGFGYLFLRQKQNEKPADKPIAAHEVSATALTPAPRGQASEYNYMKRALDRAHDVRDQAQAQTQEAQNP